MPERGVKTVDVEDGELRRDIRRALARSKARADFARMMQTRLRETTEAKDE